MRTTIASLTIFALAPVLGAAVAQAQTSVTRQITREPVETTVTQGPNGVAVTRRILTPEPGISTYLPPPPAYSAYPTVATEAVESDDYVEPAPLPRRVTTTTTARTVGQAPARTRTAAVREHPRPAHTTTHTVTAPPVSDQALVLSPAQRQVIYRSVVEREYVPTPVPAGPPVVAQSDFYPPPPSGYPLRAVDTADAPDYAYDPYHDDYRPTYRPVYRPAPLVVGARVPQSVPLYAVPEPVAARIPVAAPYSYAVIDNRVFLVDPATDVIVAEITQ